MQEGQDSYSRVFNSFAICLQSRQTRNEGPARHHFVTDPVESISSQGLEENVTGLAYFPKGFS